MSTTPPRAPARKSLNGGADAIAIAVCASLRVMDVVDVDTVNETFTITCELLLEWGAPDTESLHGENGLVEGLDRRDKDWRPEWWPSWEIFGLRYVREDNGQAIMIPPTDGTSTTP